MSYNFRAFISCSYDKHDEKVIDYFVKIAKAFSFVPYLAFDGHPDPPLEKIKAQLVEADCLIAICTKRTKIENSLEWKTSDWISNEIGMAVMANKPIIAFIEEGVTIKGLLSNVTSWVIFRKDGLAKGLYDFIAAFFNLYKSMQKSLVRATDLSVSYIRNNIIHKTEVFPDGSNELTTEVELLSLENNLDTTTHRAYTEAEGEISVKAVDFEFYPISSDRIIKHQFKKNERKEVIVIIYFEPPLNTNDSVKYGFRKRSPKSNPISLNEIENMIKTGEYPINEPFDYEGMIITTPTNHFKREISFPRGWKISNMKYDVFIGRSNNRDKEEYLRIKENKCFKNDFFGNQWKLSLDVANPRMGCCYYIFWQPPKI